MDYFDLDTPVVRRLRDALLRGLDPAAGAPGGSANTADAVLARIAPFLETMYLMMVIDGRVADAERSALRGAFDFLGQGQVPPARLDALLADFGQRLAAGSPEARLQAIGAFLSADRTDREMAFSLAAAVALADDSVNLYESGLLLAIAEWFGISNRRSRQLLEAMD